MSPIYPGSGLFPGTDLDTGQTVNPGQTFGDLVTAALSNDFESTVMGTTVRQAIKDGIGEMVRIARPPGTERTATLVLSAGVAKYPLPFASYVFVDLIDIYDPSTGLPLATLPVAEFDKLVGVAGPPQVYALFDNNILLYPTPAATETLVWRFNAIGLPALDTDFMAQVTGIPESYLYALICFARYRMFQMEDDAQMATYWRGEFDKNVHTMQADMGGRNGLEVRQVPGMFSSRVGPSFRRPT